MNIYTDSNLYVPGLIITPKSTGVKRKKISRSVTFICTNKFGKDYENSLKQIVVLSIGFTVFIEFLESFIQVNEIHFSLVIGIMKLSPTPDPL